MKNKFILVSWVFAILAAAAPAWAIKVATWDIMGYPKWGGPARDSGFRLVLNRLNPDILTVQGMTEAGGVTSFLDNVLNFSKPGAYAPAYLKIDKSNDIVLYYKKNTISFLSQKTIPAVYLNIMEYVLRIKSGSGQGTTFRIYGVHLFYSSTTPTNREKAARTLRNYLNALPADSLFLVCGNLNVFKSSEKTYKTLTGSESDNDGRLSDPVDRPGEWHGNASFANLHTQSTHKNPGGGYAGGGLDDRFDFILVSQALLDGKALDYAKGSYLVYGNDGKHFNKSINDSPYTYPKAVLDALYLASDHLPVLISLKEADGTSGF